MKHIKYPRIMNHHDRRQRERAESLATSEGVRFVGTEKVHGSNFSYSQDKNGEVHFARRNGVLKSGDSFYGWQRVASAYRAQLGMLVDEIFRTRPQATRVIVFGELCGGSYPGQVASVKRPVQSEIPYCRDVQFVAFDILVDAVFLSHSHASRLLDARGIPRAPVVYLGQTLPNAPSEFLTTRVPLLFNEDPDHALEAEGYVVLPDVEHAYTTRGYIGLKFKAARFTERKVKPPPTMDPSEQDTVQRLATLICPARVASVASKELDTIHPGLLAVKVAADAITESGETVSKSVRKQLTSLSRPLALAWHNRKGNE